MSHHDTFDYKPQLVKDDGKGGPGGGTLTASKFKFKQYGSTGSWFSELLPNLAQHADKLTWLRGLHTDSPAHPQAVVQLHTGSANAALTRPSLGAWLLYGLGSDNQPVAALIADLDQHGLLKDTLVLFGSEFGRQPTQQGKDGRDHNITGYPMFLLGAGVKPGLLTGRTMNTARRPWKGRCTRPTSTRRYWPSWAWITKS